MALGPGDVIGIAALCYQIYNTFDGVREKAPLEFQQLANEFDHFNSVFQAIHRLEVRNSPEAHHLSPYLGWTDLAGTLARCQVFLEKFKPVIGADWSTGRVWRTVRWPLSKEAQILRRQIKSHAFRLNLHLQAICTQLQLEVVTQVRGISSMQSTIWKSCENSPTVLPTSTIQYLEPSSVIPDETRFVHPNGQLGTASSSERSYSYDTYGSVPGTPVELTTRTAQRLPHGLQSPSLHTVARKPLKDTPVAIHTRKGKSPEGKSRQFTDCSSYSASPTQSPSSSIDRSPRQSRIQEATIQRNWSWDTAALSHSPMIIGSPALNWDNEYSSDPVELDCHVLPPPAQNQYSPAASRASDSSLEQYQSTNGSPELGPSSRPHSMQISQAVFTKQWTPLGYKAILGSTEGQNDRKLMCQQCKASSREKACLNILSTRESRSAAVVIRATCDRSGETVLEAQFTGAPTSYTKHTLYCPKEKHRVFFKDVDPSSIRLTIKGANAEKLPFVELANEDDHKAFQEMLHGEDLLCAVNVNQFKTSHGVDRSQSLRLWRDRCTAELRILFWASLDKHQPGRFWKLCEADVSLQRKVSHKDNAIKLVPVKHARGSPKWKFTRRSSTCSQSSDSTCSSNSASHSASASAFKELEVDFNTLEDRKQFLMCWDAHCRPSSS